MVLIGFGYKARHGKDSACRAIIEKYGDKYDIRKYAFGDELKREVNELDQFEVCVRNGIAYDTNPDMSDPMCQTKHGKQPLLLQFWGMFRRKQDQFYWVNKVHARLMEEKPQIALISDLRFLNEYYYIRALGGFTVKVEREGFVDLTRDPNHTSENQLNNQQFYAEIKVAEGDLEGLKQDAYTVFDSIVEALTPQRDAIEGVAVAA